MLAPVIMALVAEEQAVDKVEMVAKSPNGSAVISELSPQLWLATAAKAASQFGSWAWNNSLRSIPPTVVAEMKATSFSISPSKEASSNASRKASLPIRTVLGI